MRSWQVYTRGAENPRTLEATRFNYIRYWIRLLFEGRQTTPVPTCSNNVMIKRRRFENKRTTEQNLEEFKRIAPK